MLEKVEGRETSSPSFEEKAKYSNGEPPEPISENGDTARPLSTPQLRYMLWSFAFLVSLAAGSWGLVGGWWFGLPLGGEIREDVYRDNRLHWRDFFVTIPHP